MIFTSNTIWEDGKSRCLEKLTRRLSPSTDWRTEDSSGYVHILLDVLTRTVAHEIRR